MVMDFSDTSSDGLEEHNVWNPMLELFLHAHAGDSHGSVGRLKKGLGRSALSCHFALDILCDKK